MGRELPYKFFFPEEEPEPKEDWLKEPEHEQPIQEASASDIWKFIGGLTIAILGFIVLVVVILLGFIHGMGLIARLLELIGGLLP